MRRFSDFFLEDADPNTLLNYVRRMKLAQEQQGFATLEINITDILPPVITNIINNGVVVDVARNWEQPFVFDEFVGALDLPTNIGSLGWEVNNDANLVTSPIAAALAVTHPGFLKLNTQADLFAYLTLPTSWVMPNTFSLMQFIGLSEDPTEADDGVVYGAAWIDPFDVDRTMEGIYFSFIFGETNWQAVTRDAITSTVTDTGVPFDGSQWFLFEIKRTGTDTFQFYINQNLVATHTTNITEFPVQPTVGMSSQTVGSFGVYIDYFGMMFAPITERWD